MLYRWGEGLRAGGGVDKGTAAVPCKCKGCGKVVSSKKLKQDVQFCSKCRGGGKGGRK